MLQEFEIPKFYNKRKRIQTFCPYSVIETVEMASLHLMEKEDFDFDQCRSPCKWLSMVEPSRCGMGLVKCNSNVGNIRKPRQREMNYTQNDKYKSKRQEQWVVNKKKSEAVAVLIMTLPTYLAPWSGAGRASKCRPDRSN